MKHLKQFIITIIVLLGINFLGISGSILAPLSVHSVMVPDDDDKDKTKRRGLNTKNKDDNKKKKNIKAQPKLDSNIDSIPDSLLNPRWKIQRTVPVTDDDLNKNAADLELPENLKQTVEYNDTLDMYIIGAKSGEGYIGTPTMMTPEEYRKWSEKQEFNQYFRDKNDEVIKAKGKEKFSFSDMHFDLGPAEKIFGPGGVRVKTQGTAELKFGATLKKIDNPSLPIRNRKTTTMDFDEKINLHINGKVGDKVNMNLNYNTDATFDFDSQNLKLKYEGKEDEIIKLIEIGNVSFPASSSLIKGASSLFGVRTDMQFGKLKLQTIISQKKSSSKSVSSQGGVQLTPYEINVADYEENRHFFLSRYFRNKYDESMKTLPNITTGITINRVEIWVTNKSANTTNTRNIIALTDLGENISVSNNLWSVTGTPVPSNNANSEYSAMTSMYDAARDINQTSTVFDGIPGFIGGSDYEKLESARLLTSSEYKVNNALGYVSLKTGLQPDQVLAIAYEYTYGGVTYQVGEFASDITDTKKALFVKSLKNTNNNPQQGNWDLMMKNVYYLASSIEKTKFRLDVKYQSDTTGVYVSYIPEQQIKDQTIIRVLGADRLDNNNHPHPNGYFDFVPGYTVSDGRVFFPEAEPFGDYMYKYLIKNGISPDKAEKYSFHQLYDSTKTVAKQIAEKNKYIITGQYKGTSENIISLGAYNVPRGSVVVTAGGVTLTEGSDYSVDYSAGEVTILNQSIVDAGTPINVSLESNTDFGQQRKTMLGINWEYDFSKNLQLTGTIQHLSEQSLTTKVAMGAEPLNNTLWGIGINWTKESQWLTNMLDKIPFLHCTAPSTIQFTGEFAQLIAGKSHGTQDNASYIDDFENTKSKIDVSTPSQWIISSVPTMFPEYKDKTSVKSGYNRSLLAWYNIDPLFTRRSSSLTPSHIKSDLKQLSNHYVREIYVNELYPNRDQSSYNGATATLPILNLAFYPAERGPYNLNPMLNAKGQFDDTRNKWGGMMRKLDVSDFQAANIEYIEFWMLDPFIYTNEQADAAEYGGDFYINLGDVSEDVLRDGKKFFESGMPVDGSNNFTTTHWGKVPTQSNVTYAFATSKGARAKQDVGFNGLTNEEEREFGAYKEFLTQIQGKVAPEVFDSLMNDPANDDYHYFRGKDFDEIKLSILDRYKRINNPQGNSPDSDNRNEKFDTSYKTHPDVEDINQDYTLNEYEKYYQYHVSIRPEDMVVGQNHIVDKRIASRKLRDGTTSTVTWYQFRIPLNEYEDRVGSISELTSVRFMRMFLTNFKKPIVMRFGSLDLVRGDWRIYNQQLTSSAETGTINVSAVNIEENGDKTPVNYVLPPGIRRGQDPTQPQLVEENEQALNIIVKDLSTGESKAVYKNATIDVRQYKRMQMFVHANVIEPNVSDLQDNQLALFVRLGSDYKNNYYEYEIPLKLTPAGVYNKYSTADKKVVWPEENMLDIDLGLFTKLKKDRNMAKAAGAASFASEFSAYDEKKPNNKISIVGNPTLGEVKTFIIGVRNKSGELKSGEVWVNELRLLDFKNNGGWAAQGTLNVQLSDVGSFNATGKMITEGFGGLEEGIMQRSKDDYKTYSMTANVELGKFFPDKAKVSAPLYYSITKEETRPKYNPMDTDMELQDALDATTNSHERDSIESIAVKKTTNTSFSLSNVNVGIKTKGHPMPYDPANFTFSYSHNHYQKSGVTTVYEKEDNWRGAFAYSYTPVYKTFEPFKKLIKGKSKWLTIFKRFGINYLPQNISFNTEMTRNYYELQERDMEDLGGQQLPLTFSEQFLWNRDFSIRWDLTRTLHMNFSSATHAQIEEPYTPINKDLYPDAYSAWKDSVWTSIKHMGRPLDYNQSFSASYMLPINLIPIFDWVNTSANYNATYSWTRGSELDDGTSLGNTIVSNRDININGTFNLERLYNHIPFLKKANERFNKRPNQNTGLKNYDRYGNKRKEDARKRAMNGKKGKDEKDDKDDKEDEKKKKKNMFEKEITIKPDTVIELRHGKNTRRIVVSAKTKDGKSFELKFKKKDKNTLRIVSNVDSLTKVKVSVRALEPLDNEGWYKTMQCIARGLMSVRKINISYRNQYSMTLPGFMPEVGNAFGQRGGDIMAPGLDFAFGMIGDSYLDKAMEHNWLMTNDSVATPATTNGMINTQIRVTLEPVKDFKIDLTASHSRNKARSIQYMYEGTPTTESGSLNMTTISLKTAFEGMGSANNGFKSSAFEKFCKSLDGYRQRVEDRYTGTKYPEGTTHAGEVFNPENGAVNKYSADVMIPAFLDAYTNMGSSFSLFPTLAKVLPNWTVRYSGLSKLRWIKDHFKSVNINHGYKSIYAIGSYSTFNTYNEYMNGRGFINDAATGNPIPSSRYNISMVSINEAFSPLLGIDVTMHNDLTCKLEYRKTRVLNLSMTSVQINETMSNDWVFGLGYRINNFNPFGPKKKHVKKKPSEQSTTNNSNKNNKRGGFNSTLNLRLDFSYRKQAAISRDISSMLSNASSGNTALKLSFMADYSLSKILTMSFYYDRQTNTPLLSSNSYPTTTSDFGLSLKFSLNK